MVEATRVKLVGMGLEAGVRECRAISIPIEETAPGEAPPPMGVLRWWFELDYDAVAAARIGRRSPCRTRREGAQREQQLTAAGQRIHTGA